MTPLQAPCGINRKMFPFEGKGTLSNIFDSLRFIELLPCDLLLCDWLILQRAIEH